MKYEELEKLVLRRKKQINGDSVELVKWYDYSGNENNHTPFLHCIFNRFIETETSKEEKNKLLLLAREILNVGADPNVTLNYRKPLLHRTIFHKEKEFMQLLIECGRLNYGEKQHEGHKTALQVVLESWPEQIELIKFLSTKNNNELQDILIEAANNRDLKKLTFLIKYKLVDINQPDANGFLLLHLLCLMGDIKFLNSVRDIFKVANLVFNFNQQDKFRNTALHLVCHKSSEPNLDIVEWLFSNGINPDVKNANGDTALHVAIGVGSFKLILLLINNKANANQQDDLGRTPLAKLLMRPELIRDVSIIQLLSASQTSSAITIPMLNAVDLAYEQGFWVRKVGAYGYTENETAITREINILNKRETLSSEELSTHNPDNDVNANVGYYFSPATFVKKDIPTGLFGSEGFGVIIQTNKTIPLWCSGLVDEIMSAEDINFSAKKLEFIVGRNKYSEEHQCQNKTSNEIALQLQRLYEERIKHLYCKGRELYEHLTQPSRQPYNEGLFRYIKGEIIAFYVSANPSMAYYALKLREGLKSTQIPFYLYEERCRIQFISDDQVKALAATYDPAMHNNPLKRSFMLPTALHTNSGEQKGDKKESKQSDRFKQHSQSVSSPSLSSSSSSSSSSLSSSSSSYSLSRTDFFAQSASSSTSSGSSSSRSASTPSSTQSLPTKRSGSTVAEHRR